MSKIILQSVRSALSTEAQRLLAPVNALSNGAINKKYISNNEFEKFCTETLEELSDLFDELGDTADVPQDYDASLNNGVLTIKFGSKIGTYVINKQSPNQQIWLSSPISGPKRFDFINNGWQYSHTKQYLHELLENEFSQIMSKPVHFKFLKYYKKQSAT